MGRCFRVLTALLLLTIACSEREENAIYAEYCSGCHESDAVERAANRTALSQLTPEHIVAALETGVMLGPGRLITADQKREVAEYLTGRPLGASALATAHDPTVGACGEGAGVDRDFSKGLRWNGWGGDLANSRFQPATVAGLTPSEVPHLRLKWAFGIPAAIFAQAQLVVMGGLVFIGTPGGTVYALDASSGCTAWSYTASRGVRSAISVGPIGQLAEARYAAYFGDFGANVYAVDALTGAEIWRTPVDDHPHARITGAPRLHAGRLYVPVSSLEHAAAQNPEYACCRFRGSVVALDAADGRQIWKTYTIDDEPRPRGRNAADAILWGPSGASVWNAPTVDLERSALYVGTGNNYSQPPSLGSDSVLALDLETGALLWSRQLTSGDAWNVSCITPDRINCPWEPGPDVDVASSPILRRSPGGGRVLVVGQKSGAVYGLDPDASGTILWEARLGRGGMEGAVTWGSAADEELVYVAVSVMIAERPELGGGLYALRLSDGEIVWHTPSPRATCGKRPGCRTAQTAAVTAIPGVVLSGSRDGHLRAYSTATGEVLWDFDTVRDYQTVNEVAARGGSLNAAGPAVVGGVVYVNSGYGAGGMPGNVLLALQPE